jgi:hypothetical protein
VCSIAVVMVGLSACAGVGSSASPAATSSGQVTGVAASVIGTDFAVGSNRFTFTLVNNNQPITGARPVVYFFSLHGFNATPAGSGIGTFESVGSLSTGIYVTHTTFDQAGKWGAEIDLQSGGKKRSLQTIFDVTAHSVTPAVGAAAPPSRNPTVSQVPVSKLDSGVPPDDMHRDSIAGAIARHRPLLVLFASAAYCGTFQCGPEIAAVRSLERPYRASVDFVHVDVFHNARPPRLSTTAIQWHIRSQPWVFIVNRHGSIVAKFEGPAPASELKQALRSAVR